VTGLENWTDILAIAIAALAALLSYFSSREARKSSAKASEAALSAVEIQVKLQSNDLKLQYHNEVREWAASSIECLGDLISICYLDPEKCDFNYRERQVVLVNKLSSLIDSGRWFFPNDKSIAVGLHKDEAFQGFRHEALNQLVDAFRAGLKIDYKVGESNSERAEEIEGSKRRFTSIIQGYIKTSEWVRIINETDHQRSPNNGAQMDAAEPRG
jgi:hypothetical protein